MRVDESIRNRRCSPRREEADRFCSPRRESGDRFPRSHHYSPRCKSGDRKRPSHFQSLTVLAATALILYIAATAGSIEGEPVTPEPATPESASPSQPASEATHVRAWRIEPREIPTHGPFAQAQAGDFALSDGDVVMTVASAERGGEWLDAGHVATEGFDYLKSLTPSIRTSGTLQSLQITIQSVELESGDSGGPAIRVRAALSDRPDVKMETRYELRSTSDVIVATTQITNGGTEALGPIDLCDRIAWGADYVFLPYSGNLLRPAGRTATKGWACSWQDDFGLGIVPSTGTLRLEMGSDSAVLVYGQETVEPGKTVEYRRSFPVIDREIAKISEFVWRNRGERLGWLEGSVEETGTGQLVANCRVEILTYLPGQPGAFPLTWLYTDEQGRFRLALPAGRYFPLTHRAVGRVGGGGISYDVAAGEVTALKRPLQVTPEVKLRYEVRDADTEELIPCKIAFQPYPKTQPVDFGPIWNGPGARNAWFSKTGEGELVITPGTYLAVVSHGIEYDVAEVRQLDVKYGQDNVLNVSLKHVLKKKDSVSVDFGVLTEASPGCMVSPEDRVIAAAVEGVQCLVTGDIGVVTDLAPAIEAAGLSDLVQAIPGRRIVWSGEKARGGLLVFPCPPGPVAADQLERERNAATADELVGIVRAAYPESLITACRPMDEENGYLVTQGYDDVNERTPYLTGEKDEKLPVPKALDFDLFEVFPADERLLMVDRIYRRMYIRFLREVQRYGVTGASHSRYLWGRENGYPRTYVPVADGDGNLFARMRESLVKGNVLATNGPFIRLLVNGQGPGSFITDTDGRLNILLECQAASWVDVRSVVVFDGEFFTKQFLLPPSNEIRRYPTGPLASPEFVIPLDHDVIISATAVGQRSLSPVAVEDDRYGFLTSPYALTGPIFVDADGDGKCTPPGPLEGIPEYDVF